MMRQKNTIKDYLGTKELYRGMAAIAIPISLRQMITVGVNLMDTVVLRSIGQMKINWE